MPLRSGLELGAHRPKLGRKSGRRRTVGRHRACTYAFHNGEKGWDVYRDVLLVMFATAAGFTASGILANLYRLVAAKPESLAGRMGYIAVMVVAGPNVLFENAANSLKAKDCSQFAFWLAASIAAYWSFALGMIVIQLGLAI